MQTIATLVADIAVLLTSLLLIANRVHGIVAKFLSAAVVTTMCFFVVAYVATCAHKGECAWTKQEFAEVFMCTIRPDQCTYLLPQIAGAANAAYWKTTSEQLAIENAQLRTNIDLVRRQPGGQGSVSADQKEADRRRSDAIEIAKREAERQRQENQATEERLRQAEADAAEERRRIAAQTEDARLRVMRSARTLTWRIQSYHPYSVDLSFFGALGNRAWPGGDKVWILADSEMHTYPLECTPGEKICYGAWTRGNIKRYWGSGYGGRQSCTACCYHCGDGDTKAIALD